MYIYSTQDGNPRDEYSCSVTCGVRLFGSGGVSFETYIDFGGGGGGASCSLSSRPTDVCVGAFAPPIALASVARYPVLCRGVGGLTLREQTELLTRPSQVQREASAARLRG